MVSQPVLSLEEKKQQLTRLFVIIINILTWNIFILFWNSSGGCKDKSVDMVSQPVLSLEEKTALNAFI